MSTNTVLFPQREVQGHLGEVGVNTDAQRYWTRHNQWFDALYTKATWFDRFFRKDVYYRMATASRVCREVKGATVLDLGCGSGHVARGLLTEAGASHVTGIDFSRSMLELAQQLLKNSRLAARVTLMEEDILSHDFGPQRFDVVLALGVFDYVGEPKALWERMANLAQYALVASFPLPQFPRSQLRRWRYMLSGCPVYFYSRGELDQLVGGSPGVCVEFLKGQASHILVGRRITKSQPIRAAM
jgi:SAM-dependent methyltransferase